MKTLTLTQPYASLVACGAKRVETRGWRTDYRGLLAIHAAKGFPRFEKDLANCRVVRELLGRLAHELPLGSVVATCRLVSCHRTNEIEIGSCIGVLGDCAATITEQEYALGNYDPGRWAWLLADIKPLAEPVPAKGALSLWEWKP